MYSSSVRSILYKSKVTSTVTQINNTRTKGIYLKIEMLNRSFHCFSMCIIFLYFVRLNNCKLLSKNYSGIVLRHSYTITAVDAVPVTSKSNETAVSKLWAKTHV